MTDPQDLWLSEEQVRAYQAAQTARNRERKGRQPRKSPKVDFLQHSIPLLLALRKANPPGIVYAMVWALSEAWFTTGLDGQHLNPFPLARIDFKKWKIDRSQKTRALRFLVRIRLIEIDRSDPENVLVAIFWASRYTLEARRDAEEKPQGRHHPDVKMKGGNYSSLL
jgi:hypothetical protein